jgi:hypothetical protein
VLGQNSGAGEKLKRCYSDVLKLPATLPEFPTMNIFFLSRKIRRCARWHCDKHVVKMILEYTQMLYTTLHMLGGTENILSNAPLCASTGVRGYKVHAKNHPSTKWVRESRAHYDWLLTLALALVEEHMYRFAPKTIHACHAHLEWLRANPPKFSEATWRDPPTAMPEEFRISPDSVLCYIAYYNGSKRDRGLLKYTKRHVPHVLSKGGYLPPF